MACPQGKFLFDNAKCCKLDHFYHFCQAFGGGAMAPLAPPWSRLWPKTRWNVKISFPTVAMVVSSLVIEAPWSLISKTHLMNNLLVGLLDSGTHWICMDKLYNIPNGVIAQCLCLLLQLEGSKVKLTTSKTCSFIGWWIARWMIQFYVMFSVSRP